MSRNREKKKKENKIKEKKNYIPIRRQPRLCVAQSWRQFPKLSLIYTGEADVAVF